MKAKDILKRIRKTQKLDEKDITILEVVDIAKPYLAETDTENLEINLKFNKMLEKDFFPAFWEVINNPDNVVFSTKDILKKLKDTKLGAGEKEVRTAFKKFNGFIKMFRDATPEEIKKHQKKSFGK